MSGQAKADSVGQIRSRVWEIKGSDFSDIQIIANQTQIKSPV